MVGELIMLPLRVGIRATRLWLRATEETVAVVADATGRLIDQVTSGGPPPAAPERDPTRVEPPPSLVSTPTSATDVPPAAPEPEHVSERPELVEEVAEPGAEAGAGAAIHVQEPWQGYEQMPAGAVIDRLAGASAAELAAIQLYETASKRRVTVLEAVEQQLRVSSGSGSPR